MNRRSLTLTIIASALASALVASLLTMKWHHREETSHHDQGESRKDFHHWLHDNLDLTAEQKQTLHPIEDQFEEEQKHLRKEISEAADTLAHAIRDHDREGPEIETALTRLHQTQLKLQKLSLDHFFQMKSQLNPKQAEKLLRWTHDSIVGNHAH